MRAVEQVVVPLSSGSEDGMARGSRSGLEAADSGAQARLQHSEARPRWRRAPTPEFIGAWVSINSRSEHGRRSELNCCTDRNAATTQARQLCQHYRTPTPKVLHSALRILSPRALAKCLPTCWRHHGGTSSGAPLPPDAARLRLSSQRLSVTGGAIVDGARRQQWPRGQRGVDAPSRGAREHKAITAPRPVIEIEPQVSWRVGPC